MSPAAVGKDSFAALSLPRPQQMLRSCGEQAQDISAGMMTRDLSFNSLEKKNHELVRECKKLLAEVSAKKALELSDCKSRHCVLTQGIPGLHNPN